MGRKKGASPPEGASRRERQILDILLRREEATVSEVRQDLPDPPSYDSVRTILRILTEKGVADRRTERPPELGVVYPEAVRP